MTRWESMKFKPSYKDTDNILMLKSKSVYTFDKNLYP